MLKPRTETVDFRTKEVWIRACEEARGKPIGEDFTIESQGVTQHMKLSIREAVTSFTKKAIGF